MCAHTTQLVSYRPQNVNDTSRCGVDCGVGGVCDEMLMDGVWRYHLTKRWYTITNMVQRSTSVRSLLGGCAMRLERDSRGRLTAGLRRPRVRCTQVAAVHTRPSLDRSQTKGLAVTAASEGPPDKSFRAVHRRRPPPEIPRAQHPSMHHLRCCRY